MDRVEKVLQDVRERMEAARAAGRMDLEKYERLLERIYRLDAKNRQINP